MLRRNSLIPAIATTCTSFQNGYRYPNIRTGCSAVQMVARVGSFLPFCPAQVKFSRLESVQTNWKSQTSVGRPIVLCRLPICVAVPGVLPLKFRLTQVCDDSCPIGRRFPVNFFCGIPGHRRHLYSGSKSFDMCIGSIAVNLRKSNDRRNIMKPPLKFPSTGADNFGSDRRIGRLPADAVQKLSKRISCNTRRLERSVSQ